MKPLPQVLNSIKDLEKDQVTSLLKLAKKFNSQKFQNHSGIPISKSEKAFVSTLFFEDSTRTRNSFAVATKKLGMEYIDFNLKSSSVNKGESLEETLNTLYYQGIDLCIIRSNVDHILENLDTTHLKMKIINGGDGKHQHPTQALLDIFTLIELGHDLENKTFLIVGDAKHSRVVNSLIDLLAMFNSKLIICGPEQFQKQHPNVDNSDNLTESLKIADFVYMLRVQKERHDEEFNLDDYHHKFGLTRKRVDQLKKPILHPGPINLGVELSKDVIQSPYYLGYQQVSKSIPMRMALIQSMVESNINKTTHITNNYTLERT